MIGSMKLSPALAWLVDEAGASTDADRFLAELGARLIDDGVPLMAGALTLLFAAPDHRSPDLAVAVGDRRGDRGVGLRRGARRR